ncbi:hypothetical protein [Planomonospora venezuelensis]|uniref:Uncharacterized protein n=1 Tax=Planomonospora venezuelensis TaxID=1999 RepID=A0A841CVJ1_PLAVE|nr:hypothetical protein [Planomonospora venezuelensis]MBB5961329.1 hypothetical protein [Planomonospora venezuelensis]
MGPDIHFDLMVTRTAELRAEAAEHRMAREAVEARKSRSGETRRRGLGLFRKTTTA